MVVLPPLPTDSKSAGALSEPLHSERFSTRLQPTRADIILVYVPKLSFNSKYSNMLRFSQPKHYVRFTLGALKRGTAMQKCGHRHALGLCRACPKHLCQRKGRIFFLTYANFCPFWDEKSSFFCLAHRSVGRVVNFGGYKRGRKRANGDCAHRTPLTKGIEASD